ncbi:MAG: hypothetical protein Q8K70_00075 [Bacteroidota bacterium]|nr:hypothetical protein [Bacteroidota bacterium]
MNNKEFFYINVNNKTLDSFGINFVDSLNLKPQVILIDNHKYSNFLFNENYLLVALPLFHINEYQCYVYKFNKQKDKITCFDIFDFSGSINFNSKNSKLEYYSNKEIEILTEGDLPIQKIIDEKINLIISKLCES